MFPLGLALKLGLHPVAMAHLSPGTNSFLVSYRVPAGGSTDSGREYTNVMHFHSMLYVCIMDKRKNHFYLVLLQENHFFYCCLGKNWVPILLVSQTPTGGSKDVGREYANAICFCPTLYICIMDKKTHL
jgi:hypothetical protein